MEEVTRVITFKWTELTLRIYLRIHLKTQRRHSDQYRSQVRTHSKSSRSKRDNLMRGMVRTLEPTSMSLPSPVRTPFTDRFLSSSVTTRSMRMDFFRRRPDSLAANSNKTSSVAPSAD